MRAAGKSTLGKVAAQCLNQQLLDLDAVLEEKVLGCKIGAFVDKNGWPAFRAAEAKLLEDVLLRGYCVDDPAGNCVIATGGGVIETPSALELLRRHRPVVWVDRHIDDILHTLEGVGSYRPGLGEHPSAIYERRRPLYVSCSDFVFPMRRGDEAWSAIEERFAHLARWAAADGTGVDPANLVCAPIVAATVDAAVADIREALANGAGFVELRLDKMTGGPEAVCSHLPALMAAARSHALVVVATFRPTWEDPSAGYSGEDGPRFKALRQAAELGAAFVDVENRAVAAWNATGGLPRGCSTRLVVSSHNFQKTLSLPELRALYADMRALAGVRGVVKLAQMAPDSLSAARMMVVLAEADGPSVAISMGEAGTFTRFLAPRFSASVLTFGALSGRASAPGQPTADQMLRDFRLGALTAKTKVYGLLRGDDGAASAAAAMTAAAAIASGLSAVGADAMCVPVAVKGCTGEEFAAALPNGLLANWRMEDFAGTASSSDALAEQARRLYAAFVGGPVPPEAVVAIRATIEAVAAAAAPAA